MSSPSASSRRWRSALFAALTVVLIWACLELGAFLLLALSAGELVTWADVHSLQASRQGIEPLEPVDRPKRWSEHRMGYPPVLHPYLGYVYSPHRPMRPGAQWHEEATDFGLRIEHSPFQEPSDDLLVVGVLGGSVAEQLALSGQLEVALKQLERVAGREPVVIPLCMGGYKQPQQLMALNYFLALGAHFDLVINIDGFNEVALPLVTNLPKGYHPFYPRGWVLLVEDLDQELRQILGELAYYGKLRSRLASTFNKPPWRYSMLAALLWKSLDARLTREIVTAEEKILEQEPSPSANYQAYGPRWRETSREETVRNLAEVWHRTSAQIHSLTAGLGIEYFHFLQPNQYVPHSKDLTADERASAWHPKHPYKLPVEEGYPLLREAGEHLTRSGVSFYDLTMLFKEKNETVYRDACCHFNTRGNQLLAEAIAKTISSKERKTSGSRLQVDRLTKAMPVRVHSPEKGLRRSSRTTDSETTRRER